MAISRFATSTLRQGMPKYTEMWDGSTLYPPPGFDSIATVTATGGEASVTFSSIPSTYQHLQIRGIYRDTATTAGQEAPLFVAFNGVTSNQYASHYLRGDGSTASASGVATTSWIRLDGAGVCAYTTSGIYGANIIDIHNYANTSQNKTLRHFGGGDANAPGTQFRVSLSSGFRNNTDAITSVTIYAGNSGYAAGSTFELYGIRSI